MKNHIILCCLLFISIVFKPLLLRAASFYVGEKLEYSLSWGDIPAGSSSMEITEIVNLNGKKAYHVVSTTWSNKFVSAFYKVNSRIDSYVDMLNFSSLKLEITEQTGRRNKHEEVYFNSKNNKIIYKKNGEERILDGQENLYDSISSIYFLRSLDIKPGKTINIKTFSNGKIYNVTIHILDRETISTGSGSFNTVKAHSVIMNKDLSEKKGETYIWLNDDEYSTPVKIETKINVGTITAALINASGQTERPETGSSISSKAGQDPQLR